MPCSAGSMSCSGSGDGLPDGPAGQKCSAAGTGSASTVTVTVVQCINSGIDSDATSTMAQEVMCTCGFRTRKRFKPIHTTPPRTGSAAPTPPESPALFPPSLRLVLVSVLVSLVLALWPSQPGRPACAADAGRASPYPPCRPGPLRRSRCRTSRRCAGRLSPQPAARLGGLIDIGSSIHGVRGVALVFQSPQHGADGGFLQRAGKPLADGLGRDRTVGPNQLHDLAFEVAQFGQAVIHGATLRSRASMLQSVAYAAQIRNVYSIWNCRASPRRRRLDATPSCCSSQRLRSSPPPYFTSEPLAPIRR